MLRSVRRALRLADYGTGMDARSTLPRHEIRAARRLLAAVAADYPELITAYAHPLRVRLLALFEAHAGSELAPVDAARELGEPLGAVSHHIRLLRDLGVIACSQTTMVRGTVKHHYRLT